MNRFIQKSWYTLTEAADYLTHNSQGDTTVTTSDILQLAMDREITLSIRITQAGDTPLPFAELTLGDLSIPETEQSKKLRESNPSHPLSDVLLFEGEQFNPIFLGNGDIYTGIWDIASIVSGERFLGILWDISKLPDAPSLDRLDATIPTPPYPLTLVASNRDFALSAPIEAMPDGSYLGVRITELSELLSEPENVNASDQLKALPDDFRALYEALGADELPEMDLLITAWRKYWKGRTPNDGKKYPINSEVADWVKNRMDRPEQGNNKAKAIASIIRPTWAPTGRQPNRNQ
ncbi:hypothetical protein [Marinobacter sp. S6332]|uniref:hypothetical protein n=1 Tax=Marinobacter sp. S6332 TaxID=2926403 RepID=UPI001FF1FFF6|nr:hypothetical protein [Marinobacter sp. S6332]MCK0163174.1 hypothetical protein [Marinobacter sp. S6332]